MWSVEIETSNVVDKLIIARARLIGEARHFRFIVLIDTQEY